MGIESLAEVICISIEAVGEVAGRGLSNGSESPGIGSFKKVLKLGLARAWVLHILDWAPGSR